MYRLILIFTVFILNAICFGQDIDFGKSTVQCQKFSGTAGYSENDRGGWLRDSEGVKYLITNSKDEKGISSSTVSLGAAGYTCMKGHGIRVGDKVEIYAILRGPLPGYSSNSLDLNCTSDAIWKCSAVEPTR